MLTDCASHKNKCIGSNEANLLQYLRRADRNSDSVAASLILFTPDFLGFIMTVGLGQTSHAVNPQTHVILFDKGGWENALQRLVLHMYMTFSNNE